MMHLQYFIPKRSKVGFHKVFTVRTNGRSARQVGIGGVKKSEAVILVVPSAQQAMTV